jgi:hypothetical protein
VITFHQCRLVLPNESIESVPESATTVTALAIVGLGVIQLQLLAGNNLRIVHGHICGHIASIGARLLFLYLFNGVSSTAYHFICIFLIIKEFFQY